MQVQTLQRLLKVIVILKSFPIILHQRCYWRTIQLPARKALRKKKKNCFTTNIMSHAFRLVIILSHNQSGWLTILSLSETQTLTCVILGEKTQLVFFRLGSSCWLTGRGNILGSVFVSQEVQQSIGRNYLCPTETYLRHTCRG